MKEGIVSLGSLLVFVLCMSKGMEHTMWLTLYTPTSLDASSNMLLRSEMTMNCAFLVRSLMYAATMETYEKEEG